MSIRVFVFLSFYYIASIAQADKNIEFAQYIMGAKEYNEVILFLNKTKIEDQNTKNFIKGWAFYNIKQLDSSAYYLGKVNFPSENYYKSKFFESYAYVFQKKYDEGIKTLARLKLDSSNYIELRDFELAGIHLLNRKLDSGKRYLDNVNRSNIFIEKEAQVLKELYFECKDYNPKSPIFAACLSSFLPGLGQIYSKNNGTGVAFFLTNLFLGGITFENYYKSGISNYKTIVFGSLFSLFYIGNIYGAYFSVKTYRDEFNEKIEHRVLYNLHIPLRNVFN